MTDEKWRLKLSDKPRLQVGNVVLSDCAFGLLTKDEIYNALHKHQAGDWGTVGPEDWHENDEALNNRGRVKSVYTSGEGRIFWIITEGNRSVTRVLLPHEY